MSDEQDAADEVARLRDVMDRLGLNDPLPDEAMDDAAIAVGLARVHREARSGPDEQSSGARVHDLGAARRRRRWWLSGVAAAAVTALAVVLVPHQGAQVAAADGPPVLALPISPAELAAGGGEPARDVLLDLADAAAGQPDVTPAGPVQHALSQNWFLSTSTDEHGTTTTSVDPTVMESWLAPDGSLLKLEWRGHAVGDGSRLGDAGTEPGDAAVDRLPAGTFDAGRAAALPRDPAALRAALLATPVGSLCPADDAGWCLYSELTTSSLLYQVVPPDLEASLWRVLADEPGFTVAGAVTDRLGRRSVAVSVPTGPNDVDPTVRVLLIDSATGHLSGWEEVRLSSEVLGFTEPTVTEFHYEVTTSWVAEVGGGGAGPGLPDDLGPQPSSTAPVPRIDVGAAGTTSTPGG